ncbi:hypothetical protein RCC89_02890 [Cytophagaceae bacterium ABcell3]|nr:hypothetical protein RCC89_02890 [Cytophagaceae bacterium ABcell3]
MALFFGNKDVLGRRYTLQRGFAYGELNNYEMAFHDFDFCVANKFDIDIALLWRGVCYYNTGFKKDACKDWLISNHEEAKEYFKINCQGI